MGTPMIDSKAALGARGEQDSVHWGEVEEAVELLHDERFQDALYALRDIIKASPQNPYAYHFLGAVLRDRATRSGARCVPPAVRLAPNYLGARVALSHVLRMLGDFARGHRRSRRGPSPQLGRWRCVHAAGLAHAARGDNQAAGRYLRAFLASNPEFESATEVRSILATLEKGGPIAADDDPSEYD